MRDIYARKLSERSLGFDGIGGVDGEQLRTDGAGTAASHAASNASSTTSQPQRRTSMSNSMTFSRGNSISSSISSLFSNKENGCENDRLSGSGEECDGGGSSSSASSLLTLPIRLNMTLTNALSSIFQCKSDEKDLASSVEISTQCKTRTSLIDQTYSEASGPERASCNEKYMKHSTNDQEKERDQPTSSHTCRNLDTSNHSNRCPLCLDSLSSADLAHPPQCSTSKCTFNFCLQCAESYIASSKDPYQKASDGSQQLKVFLRCPSCRSDLSTTLRDTVLLRHSDIVANDSDEIKLTPSDLSLKHAMSSDSFIQTALVIAKERENKFFSDGIVDQTVLSYSTGAKTCHVPREDSSAGQKRRHSFFYGLIEEAKQAREKKREMEIHRRRPHNRRHSVV